MTTWRMTVELTCGLFAYTFTVGEERKFDKVVKILNQTFTDNLNNPNTEEYQDLADRFCNDVSKDIMHPI